MLAPVCRRPSVLITYVLNKWFVANLGLVTSLAMGCSGLAGAAVTRPAEAAQHDCVWRFGVIGVLRSFDAAGPTEREAYHGRQCQTPSLWRSRRGDGMRAMEAGRLLAALLAAAAIALFPGAA